MELLEAWFAWVEFQRLVHMLETDYQPQEAPEPGLSVVLHLEPLKSRLVASGGR